LQQIIGKEGLVTEKEKKSVVRQVGVGDEEVLNCPAKFIETPLSTGHKAKFICSVLL
jgi:hypothetical protein